jgi:catechol 2,3-dioxygenase-like lactoylglutathione lyase family enzyme
MTGMTLDAVPDEEALGDPRSAKAGAHCKNGQKHRRAQACVGRSAALCGTNAADRENWRALSAGRFSSLISTPRACRAQSTPGGLIRMLSRTSVFLLCLALVPGLPGAGIAASQMTSPASMQDPVRPAPVTSQPWLMTTASVTDLDASARFFREIGGYETLWQGALSAQEIAAFGLAEPASGEALVLAAPGAAHGWVRLVRFDNAGRKVPTRPGARAWDTGCFWSLMVRAKDMEAVYDDAIAMGWWTHTPITDLNFGDSVLKVVVFQGPDGLQVQAYERLSPPLPEAFGPFGRISQPFNIMQMTHDREAVRGLMEDVLGFGRFWFGAPYVDAQPTYMPLGIPRNLTTSVPYKAAIFEPHPGEFGRMEYIEIDGLQGHDFAERCRAPNLGWLSVTYPVADAAAAEALIRARGWEIASARREMARGPFGTADVFSIRAPDGAWIEFQGPPAPR